MSLKEFREKLDNDVGFNSKRNMLVIVCLIFLALNLSGAKLEEANTFIFKIKFTDYKGLSFLFLMSIVFLTIRYFSYAQSYHNQLFTFWSKRILQDYKLFSFNDRDGEVYGHLREAITVYAGDEPGIKTPTYVTSGIFHRTLQYDYSGTDEDGVKYYGKKHIDLTKYSDTWKRTDYFKLLVFEFKYQSDAIFKHRESLDLLAPYIISCLSLISFFFKEEILALY
jgi:hypothetical protein